MDYKKPIIIRIISIILAIFCIALVVANRLPVGAKQLGLQLLGLAGILALLYLYNRQFK